MKADAVIITIALASKISSGSKTSAVCWTTEQRKRGIHGCFS